MLAHAKKDVGAAQRQKQDQFVKLSFAKRGKLDIARLLLDEDEDLTEEQRAEAMQAGTLEDHKRKTNKQ